MKKDDVADGLDKAVVVDEPLSFLPGGCVKAILLSRNIWTGLSSRHVGCLGRSSSSSNFAHRIHAPVCDRFRCRSPLTCSSLMNICRPDDSIRPDVAFSRTWSMYRTAVQWPRSPGKFILLASLSERWRGCLPHFLPRGCAGEKYTPSSVKVSLSLTKTGCGLSTDHL